MLLACVAAALCQVHTPSYQLAGPAASYPTAVNPSDPPTPTGGCGVSGMQQPDPLGFNPLQLLPPPPPRAAAGVCGAQGHVCQLPRQDAVHGGDPGGPRPARGAHQDAGGRPAEPHALARALPCAQGAAGQEGGVRRGQRRLWGGGREGCTYVGQLWRRHSAQWSSMMQEYWA